MFNLWALFLRFSLSSSLASDELHEAVLALWNLDRLCSYVVLFWFLLTNCLPVLKTVSILPPSSKISFNCPGTLFLVGEGMVLYLGNASVSKEFATIGILIVEESVIIVVLISFSLTLALFREFSSDRLELFPTLCLLWTICGCFVIKHVGFKRELRVLLAEDGLVFFDMSLIGFLRSASAKRSWRAKLSRPSDLEPLRLRELGALNSSLPEHPEISSSSSSSCTILHFLER